MADEEANNAVNEEAVSEPATTDSAPVETNSSQVADPDFDAGFDDGESPAETSEDDEGAELAPKEELSDESDSEEGDEEGEKPQTRADKRKEQLQGEIDELSKQVDPQTEIRDMVAKRNELRQQVEQVNADVYKPATVDDLIEQVNPDTGDYYTRLEAKLEAMEQDKQVREYNDKVSDAQLTIQSEVERILREFPMFDQKSPDFNAEIAQQAAGILENSLQIDQQTGQVIGSSVSPYQLYKTIATASKASAQKAQIQGQKATEKMLSNADSGGSTSNATVVKKDSFLSGFDSES